VEERDFKCFETPPCPVLRLPLAPKLIEQCGRFWGAAEVESPVARPSRRWPCRKPQPAAWQCYGGKHSRWRRSDWIASDERVAGIVRRSAVRRGRRIFRSVVKNRTLADLHVSREYTGTLRVRIKLDNGERYIITIKEE
jgi:hypothetical protein